MNIYNKQENDIKLRNLYNYNLYRRSLLQKQYQQQQYANQVNHIKKDTIIEVDYTLEERNNNIRKVMNDLSQFYNNKDKLTYLHNLKIIKKIGTINNHSNTIYLLENCIVKKCLKFNKLGYILFNNEIKALLRLQKYDNFPKLLGWDPQTLSIYMSYCGKEITNKNIPDNYIDQFNIIKNIFLEENLSNNDILERNICVLENTIFIIDFGLCNDFDLYKTIQELYNKLDKLYKEKIRHNQLLLLHNHNTNLHNPIHNHNTNLHNPINNHNTNLHNPIHNTNLHNPIHNNITILYNPIHNPIHNPITNSNNSVIDYNFLNK